MFVARIVSERLFLVRTRIFVFDRSGRLTVHFLLRDGGIKNTSQCATTNCTCGSLGVK